MLIFQLMLYLYKTRREDLKDGFFFRLVITLIFVARFFIEFIKEKQVPFEEQMQFDMGQLLRIQFLVVGIGLIIYGLIKTKKTNSMHNYHYNKCRYACLLKRLKCLFICPDKSGQVVGADGLSDNLILQMALSRWLATRN